MQIEILGPLTFEATYEKIWNYYTDQGYEDSTHSMHIITGVYGPKGTFTIQLGGKKDLFVLFSEKQVMNENNSQTGSAYTLFCL